jgi:uncharacterized membrane protein
VKKIYTVLIVGALALISTQSCKHIPDYDDFIIKSTYTSSNCNDDTVYYGNYIQPLLTSNCGMSGCHDAGTQEAGVNVADYTATIKSVLVVLGRPDKSKLMDVINATSGEKKMPPSPRSSLTDEQKAKISKWITQGARNNTCIGGCDSTQFKFAANVLPLIDNNCKGCHSGSFPSGNVRLENYAQIKTYADNGQLLGTISYAAGYNPMPQGGNQMPACQIAVIRKWIQAGAQNN